MTIEKFHAACAPCAWLKAGMCESALKKLREAAPALLSLFILSNLFVPHTARGDAASEFEIRRVALRAKIVGKTKAPKAAKNLEKASKYLDAGKFSEAVSTAALAELDVEFADQALAIKGAASIRSAEEAIAASDENDSKKKPDWKKIEADASRSLSSWTKIIDQHLYSPLWSGAPKEVGKAELALALAKAERKANREATKLFEKAFQRLALENGSYLIRPRHLDKYAELCLKKKTDLCTSWIVKFANQYSKNSAESKRLGKIFPEIVEAGRPTFVNSKITTGYKQKDADEEAFDQVFPMVVEEEWSSAIDGFRKFLEEFPRSTHRYRARYWLATITARKHPEDAKPHYEQLVRESPLTVYGLLSMLALNQEPDGRFKGNAPEWVDHDSLQTPIEAARLARARKLLAAKADRLTATDLRSIRSRDSAPGPYLLWLASFASVSGSHLSAFSILSELIARMDESVYTAEGLDLVFPVVEWPLIEKQGTAIGVDPILVMSLIKQESAFEQDISSGVGASGYMQLMPFTASDVESDVERGDLLEAETNIRIGTKYLKKMIDRYKGNIALALSAYNAGPTAADRWVREGRASRSFMEYVEQIPYKETRDYVGSIFRNYVWYTHRVKGARVTSTDVFWPAPVPGSATTPPVLTAPK